MKHDTFEKYPADSLELPAQALLTIWDCLADYRDDLVLIGGLAIRHLTHPPKKGMPGPVTLDVDFGISIGASGGSYAGMRDILSGHGFKWAENRFVREFDQMKLFIDLLTDDGKSDTGTVIVDDGLPVGIIPGISRALENNRLITITGKTLLGAQMSHKIKVAEVGPLLVLKINAFGGRAAPKDAHDIHYLAFNYLDGTTKAIEAFKREQIPGNRGMKHALKCLGENFQNLDANGPLSCAAFRLNNQHLNPEFEPESLQIRQQCVTLAQALLA